jgi:hypothetical protein
MKSFALLKTQQLFLGFFSGHYFDLKLYQKLLYTQMASDIVSFIYRVARIKKTESSGLPRLNGSVDFQKPKSFKMPHISRFWWRWAFCATTFSSFGILISVKWELGPYGAHHVMRFQSLGVF